MKSNLTEEQRTQKKIEWQQQLIRKGDEIKFNSKNKLCPRCIYNTQHLTLSSQGYFTPCCWLDDELYRNQPFVNDFFNPSLHIENNENIQDIFDSDIWKKFWNILMHHPEQAPPVCYQYCASELGDNLVVEKKDNYEIVKQH